MSSLRPKDRNSLCRFTFADGRQCRTPRSPGHPRFCSDHARKDSQARAAKKLAKDLSYFFSGEYLSACDLSAALGRLIAAVARGDIKPRSARTLAYLSQTLVQTIHLAQDEYIHAFGPDSWRKAVRNSVRQNFDYRNPSPPPEPPPDQGPVVAGRNLSRPRQETGEARAPQAQPIEPPSNCHSERSEESACSESQAALSQSIPPAPQPTPSPRTPLPPTGAEFAQRVVASRNSSRPGREIAEDQTPHAVAGQNFSRPELPTSSGPRRETRDLPPLTTRPASATQTAPIDPVTPAHHTGGNRAPEPQPAEPPSNCHSERSKESAFLESQAAPSQILSAPQQTASPSPAKARPSPPKPTPTRDPRAVHFDHTYRLLVDGKPF